MPHAVARDRALVRQFQRHLLGVIAAAHRQQVVGRLAGTVRRERTGGRIRDDRVHAADRAQAFHRSGDPHPFAVDLHLAADLRIELAGVGGVDQQRSGRTQRRAFGGRQQLRKGQCVRGGIDRVHHHRHRHTIGPAQIAEEDRIALDALDARMDPCQRIAAGRNRAAKIDALGVAEADPEIGL